MQTQAITKEQAQRIVEFVRKAWKAIKKAVQNMFKLLMRAIRKASIEALEERMELPELRQSSTVSPIGVALRTAYKVKKAGNVPKARELQRLKEYEGTIARLEEIQRRTRKFRTKKKLQKRISKLQTMSLKAAARYL